MTKVTQTHVLRFLSLVLLLSCFLGLVTQVWAVPDADPNISVHDYAELLTEEEIDDLRKIIDDLVYDLGLDLVIVTTDDNEGLTSEAYADDFYDYNGYGLGTNKDGLLMLIDMDERRVHISTTGLGIDYFNDADIEWLLDGIFEHLPDGDYYNSCRQFLVDVEYHVQSKAAEMADKIKRNELRDILASNSGDYAFDFMGVLTKDQLSSLNSRLTELSRKGTANILLFVGSEYFSDSSGATLPSVAYYSASIDKLNLTSPSEFPFIIVTLNSQTKAIDVFSTSQRDFDMPSSLFYQSKLTQLLASNSIATALNSFVDEVGPELDRIWNDYNSIGGQISRFFASIQEGIFNDRTPLAAGISAIFALITALVLKSSQSNSMPPAPSLSTYTNDSVQVKHSTDQFLRTHTARSAKPKQSSSSGGGTSTHTSSSGSSHGGGGRSF